jgi:hypothetical protein
LALLRLLIIEGTAMADKMPITAITIMVSKREKPFELFMYQSSLDIFAKKMLMNSTLNTTCLWLKFYKQ